MELRGKRILITGANGFIGGRLAERLAAEAGARVRGLIRRQPDPSVETFQVALGDVTDADAMRVAADGCAAIIHCAALQGGKHRLADFRRVNVAGTINVLRAAREAQVARVIHLSTINALGVPPPANAHADSPLVFAGDFYARTKAEGERAAWNFARDHNLALTVIRPGCTYGPRSHAWTITPINRLRRKRPVLIGAGDGMCNAIYIDNLVDLIVLALEKDAAIGQTFIGTEGRGVTWREFYGAYARLLGVPVHAMPKWFALAVTLPFEMLARLTGYPSRVARASVEFYSHRVVFDIDKSRRLLGYAPRVSFAEGMARTAAWVASGNQKTKSEGR